MARGGSRPGRKRPVTLEDLTDDQRAFYHALPEALRDRYLTTLPPVSISTAGNQKKGEQIRERIQLLDAVLAELQNQRRELTHLARSLDQGTVSASTLDLRTLLAPPATDGVRMRYLRAGRR